ncbi:MAG: hypothetical protein AAB638_02855 [Patescibacteria group bacterium]
MKTLLKYKYHIFAVLILTSIGYLIFHANPRGDVGANIESSFDKIEDSSNRQKITDSLKLADIKREYSYVKCFNEYDTTEAHVDALARFISEEQAKKPDISQDQLVVVLREILDTLGCLPPETQ